MPTERADSGAWIHPARLPLGAGWRGHCTAPGHENDIPSERQLQDGCNLGYAHACSFHPEQSEYDSIRFGVVRDTEDLIIVCYACEKDHLPAGYGTLQYDKAQGWAESHRDRRIQRMAECYVAAYCQRKAGALHFPENCGEI